MPPPEFPIGSKYLAASQTYIFLQPKLQNPYPWSVLGAGETNCSSMPQGTLLYPAYICHETPARGDHPHIHAKRNIVITLHIIHHPWSPLHPYAMGHCQPPCFHSLQAFNLCLQHWLKTCLAGRGPSAKVEHWP